MGVQIPPVLVLIVCKTILAGPPDHMPPSPIGRTANGRRTTQ